MDNIKYKRVLLKLSGEALMGSRSYGIDPEMVRRISAEIIEVAARGVEFGIVIGGGNIFRGLQASEQGMDRAQADYMGMLATMINCLALQSAMEKMGAAVRVLSALDIKEVAETYIHRRAMRHLEKGRMLIFACGTGHPYFTTDTAAALRAVEIKADVIIKATKVDGVYDKDPVKHPDAIRYDKISYTDALASNLKVMDATAISICRDNSLPLVVFNLLKRGNINRVITGHPEGTIIEV